MFKNILAFGKLTAVLAAAWLLLTPGFAAAQQGQHLYEWSGGWGRTTSPVYSVPAYPYAPPSSGVTASQAFYPVSPVANNAVEVNVSVPANAAIWFGTAKTTQRGAFREFVSPPLDPGYDYVYEVKAAWTENGKAITRTRNITVHAGDVINLDFNSVR